MDEREAMAVKDAFLVLRQAIEQDHGYAWSWHRNVALAAEQAGCDRLVAHSGAVRFMQLAFQVDTSTFPEYLALVQERPWLAGSGD